MPKPYATEQTRLSHQIRLDATKSYEERNQLGQFATPPDLAVEIARHVRTLWNGQTPIRFIDPAIGTGSFFSALHHVFKPSTIERAMGFEIDEQFATTALRLWKSRGLSVKAGDFMKQSPPELNERFNLILTNPPYVRHHHIEASEKLRLKESAGQRFNRPVSGLAGLYVYFVLLAHDWMADDGLAVWLIPSEFMDVNYGSALRDYLTQDVSLIQIHRFAPADVQFSDALVTSAVVIFRNKKPTVGSKALFSFGGSLSSPTTREQVRISCLRDSSKWTSYPQRSASGHRTKAGAVKLGELFTIKRGLATGSNNFFILPRQQAIELKIPPEATKAILPSPRHLSLSIIERSAGGWPRLEEQLALIDSTIPEEEIRRRHPGFWQYLQKGKAQGLHEGYLTSRRSPWYSQEPRPAPLFLCTYMGRSRHGRKPFRFLWNKSEATAANVYLLLYPKEPLAKLLAIRPAAAEAIFAALQQIDVQNFLGEGRVYGGGLHKIEPKELAELDATPVVNATEGLATKHQSQGFLFATTR